MGIKAIYVKRGANPFHVKYHDSTWMYTEIESPSTDPEDLRLIALDKEPPGYDFSHVEGVGGEVIGGDECREYESMRRQELVHLLHMKDEARSKMVEEHESEITRLENIDHCDGCKISEELEYERTEVCKLIDQVEDMQDALPEPSHLAQKMLVDDTLETLRAQINDNPLG